MKIKEIIFLFVSGFCRIRHQKKISGCYLMSVFLIKIIQRHLRLRVMIGLWDFLPELYRTLALMRCTWNILSKSCICARHHLHFWNFFSDFPESVLQLDISLRYYDNPERSCAGVYKIETHAWAPRIPWHLTSGEKQMNLKYKELRREAPTRHIMESKHTEAAPPSGRRGGFLVN